MSVNVWPCVAVRKQGTNPDPDRVSPSPCRIPDHSSADRASALLASGDVDELVINAVGAVWVEQSSQSADRRRRPRSSNLAMHLAA
jgi:hypothetical protein